MLNTWLLSFKVDVERRGSRSLSGIGEYDILWQNYTGSEYFPQV